MPKNPPRNKRTAGRNVKPRSIGELLQGGLGGARAPRVETADSVASVNGDTRSGAGLEWRAWLEGRLPEELRSHLGDVVSRGDRITLFTPSAAWSARFKLALAALADDIRARDARIRNVEVRVMPPGARR